MSLETEKVGVPQWLIVVMALTIVTAVLGLVYYKLPDDSAKWIGFVGGLVSALVVSILTFVTMVRPIQELDRFKRMGIRNLLSNRHNRDYYRNLVKRARTDVRVMGASCTRFVEDFLDVNSDDKALVTALTSYPSLTVRLLIPTDNFMDESVRVRMPALLGYLARLEAQLPGRVHLRRFDTNVAHSFVIVDDDLVAGPVFASDLSRHAPAVHVAMTTDFARKYSDHFDSVWNAYAIA